MIAAGKHYLDLIRLIQHCAACGTATVIETWYLGEPVVIAMRKWAASNEAVALQGCRAIRVCVLGDSYSCSQVIAAALTAWGPTSKGVALHGCIVVVHVIRTRYGNNASRLAEPDGKDTRPLMAAQFNRLGVCEVVTEVLKVWGPLDIDVAAAACEAIVELARSQECIAKFVQLGARRTIAECTQNKMKQAAMRALSR